MYSRLRTSIQYDDHHKLYVEKKHVGVADWGLLSFALFDEVDFVQVGETKEMSTQALCLGGILCKKTWRFRVKNQCTPFFYKKVNQKLRNYEQ